MPVAIDTPKDLDNRLMWAAARGDREQVEFLLAHGADVHANDDYALRWAAGSGHTDTVALLLAHGADVHARDDYALRRAAEYGHTDTVALLLAHGGNVHANDDYSLSLGRRKRPYGHGIAAAGERCARNAVCIHAAHPCLRCCCHRRSAGT